MRRSVWLGSFLPVESDRNEVRHTDPHCTLLLLLAGFFIFLFFYYHYSANGRRVGVVWGKNQDGDRRRLAPAPRKEGIKRWGRRCCVYSNITVRTGNGETMRKRSCSIQPHGSSTAQTSCAVDSRAHIGDSQRRLLSLAGRIFSRTGSWELIREAHRQKFRHSKSL